MRESIPIVVSEADKELLNKVAASRTEEARKVQRAKILLMASEGKSKNLIASEVGLSRPSVNLCINKYNEFGLEGALADCSRKGRSAKITDDENAWIRSLACDKPTSYGYAQELWTIKKLQEHIQNNCIEIGYPSLNEISRSKVWSILNKAEIKPHKIKYYLERRDPEFESKMHDVLLVYKQVELLFDKDGNIIATEDPKVITVSYDEKPGIQAIANVAEDLLPNSNHGFIARDSEYKRLGTMSLLAGLDLLTGEIIPLVRERHKSADFIEFLKALDNKYDKQDKIRLILDNHVIHTSKETRRYLESVPNRFEFVFTPKHGSWLNLIESFFSKMARVLLRGIRVKSKEELTNRIYEYIAEVNESPVIYRWTYKMDEVDVTNIDSCECKDISRTLY